MRYVYAFRNSAPGAPHFRRATIKKVTLYWLGPVFILVTPIKTRYSVRKNLFESINKASNNKASNH